MNHHTARFVLSLCFVQPVSAMTVIAAEDQAWIHYGGGLAGTRYVEADMISPETVEQLEQAWVFRTGDATSGDGYFGRRSSFKATPILVDGKLVFSTGFNRVFAIDPEKGGELWRFDPRVDFSIEYSEMFTSRGVAAWTDPDASAGSACRSRVFLGTLDARLIAVDARDGTPCRAFGRRGEVDLSDGIENFRRGEYSVTSPPTVVNSVVVVGSSIGDNGGVELDHGAVRGFDARNGALLWSWDPVPRVKSAPGWNSWEDDSGERVGAANVWSIMAADPERGVVYLPTTSPSPDFYGGERLGDNRYANSIVALDVLSGEPIWGYQIVKHDLWDYDLAAQPMLVDLRIGDEDRATLVLATKMGFVFVLDRESGRPILPVTERPVPVSDVPGERAAMTQRVPSIVLHPIEKTDLRVWARDKAHLSACERMLAGVRYEGIYTPPSLQGTLLYPGNPGGTNWGSMAAHVPTGIAFVGVNRLPTVVKLIPRREFERFEEAGTLNGVEAQFTEQLGTPYGIARFDLYDRETGLNCLEGPWATLVALDLRTGEVVWEVPAGRAQGVPADSEAAAWGAYVAGGPMVTGGGVVFLATPLDRTIRAYDMRSGEVLWSAELPAQPHATSMSYQIGDAQYVVITAGGDRADGEGRGDYVVAYKVIALEPEATRPMRPSVSTSTATPGIAGR